MHLDKKGNRHLGEDGNHALYINNVKKTHETDMEITYSQSFERCCIQPVLHLIKTGRNYNCIAMVRLMIGINE